MEVKEEEVQTPKEPVQTPKVFSLEIENIVKEKKITHMDAVLLYCYKNGIEPDKVSSLITKALKEKIEADARKLNFLPRWHNYLYELCRQWKQLRYIRCIVH